MLIFCPTGLLLLNKKAVEVPYYLIKLGLLLFLNLKQYYLSQKTFVFCKSPPIAEEAEL